MAKCYSGIVGHKSIPEPVLRLKIILSIVGVLEPSISEEI